MIIFVQDMINSNNYSFIFEQKEIELLSHFKLYTVKFIISWEWSFANYE